MMTKGTRDKLYPCLCVSHLKKFVFEFNFLIRLYDTWRYLFHTTHTVAVFHALELFLKIHPVFIKSRCISVGNIPGRHALPQRVGVHRTCKKLTVMTVDKFHNQSIVVCRCLLSILQRIE